VLFNAIIPAALLKTEKRTKAETASAGKWYQTIFTVSALPMTVIMMLLIVGYSTFNAYMVPYAEGRGIESISVFFTVMALVMLAVRPISGKLTDVFGYKRIMIPAIVAFGASFLVIGTASTLTVVLVGAVLAAVGYGSAQPALMAMCMQSVPVLKRGVASNTLYIGMDLGFFLGPLLGSVVYAVSDYPTMYLTMIVPVAVSLVLFIVLWPMYVKAHEGGIQRRKERKCGGLRPKENNKEWSKQLHSF
jgi:MFS family permease